MSTIDEIVDPPARRRVANVFFGFGLLACLVVVTGLVLALFEGSASAVFAWPTPRQLLRDVASFSSVGVLGLGLLLLLLLPIVRNATVMLVLLRSGNRRGALLAFAVALVLGGLYASLSLIGA